MSREKHTSVRKSPDQPVAWQCSLVHIEGNKICLLGKLMRFLVITNPWHDALRVILGGIHLVLGRTGTVSLVGRRRAYG